MSGPDRDPWHRLAARTPARIGLGRAGLSLPTRELLSFTLAHAQARDAVHASLDVVALETAARALGITPITVESAAADRQTYLRRPDLGRRLSEASAERLAASKGEYDLALVVADGLSATAVMRHALAVVTAFQPMARRMALTMAPLVIASQSRVALGDEIAHVLGARLVAMLIGERPGLSSPDSLGIYLTFDPRSGRTDAERNCLSNIRPEGLPPDRAAAKLAWLVDAARTRRLTGVALKDDSDGIVGPAGAKEIG